MGITATEVSLVLLGILIALVLLEVRRLGQRTPDLGQKFDALSRRLGERLDTPPTELKFRGGAQIVQAGTSLTSLSEELERLTGTIRGIESPDYSPEGMARFLAALGDLRQEIRLASDLVDSAALQMGQANGALSSASDALGRLGAALEAAIERGGAVLDRADRAGEEDDG